VLDSAESHTFGGLLRQHRLAAGLTQAALAERSGIADRTIQDLERGAARPRRATVSRLAAALSLLPAARAELDAVSSAPRRQGRAARRWDSDASGDRVRRVGNRSLAVVPGMPRDARPNKLPIQPTALLGRECEMSEISALLRNGARLVTLTGPGGVGKTRLGIEVADSLLEDFADGVFLVELAPLTDPELVPSSIAQALGVLDLGGRTLVEELREHLRPRSVLLLLDNFEHVVAAAPLVADLLAMSPDLRVLATSREPLRIRGEREYDVKPLALPCTDHLASPDMLAENPAVALFVERAAAIRSGFTVTEENGGAIAEVCTRLDGLPLAIELAAGRVRALTPASMAAWLERRLPLLTGGARDLPARHQTLRATIDWSHDLLDDDDRRLFRRLAVFVGGWTLEAAEAVAGDGGGGSPPSPISRPASPDSVLDLLAGLADKSLVVVEELEPAARYGFLETIRQYAAERLGNAGEEWALRDRHRDWFLALAERAEPELVGPEQVAWLDRLEADHDNLRAALLWCLQRPDAESGLRFGWALWRFWEGRNHLAEGRAGLDEVLALEPPAERPVLECRAQYAAGRMAFLQGDREVARRFLEPCLARARELADPELVASTLVQLGHLARDRGDLDRARAQYDESLRIWRDRDDARGIALSLLNLGRLDLMEGATEQGRALLEESLRRYRELGDPTDISRVLLFVGGGACDLGLLDQARAHYVEGLRIAARLRDRGRVSANLEGCAVLAVREGQPERALRLAATAAAIRATTGTGLALDDQRRLDDGLEQIRRTLGEATCARIVEQTGRMTLDQAIAYGLEGAGEGSAERGPATDRGHVARSWTSSASQPGHRSPPGLPGRGSTRQTSADGGHG
jgi:predicted ATPase/transcriptional regulator with XRE-family HTH domain